MVLLTSGGYMKLLAALLGIFLMVNPGFAEKMMLF
jgi:hypothetical protein